MHMSAIFISYASEDRERAKVLAHALEQEGLAVWWDRKIPLGKAFDEVIDKHLSSALCVLVLWTRSSVESRWVRAEASEAAARDVLIPLILEPGVRIPLEFRLLQAADLSHWDGDLDQPGFLALLESIRALLRKPPGGRPHAGGSLGADPSEAVRGSLTGVPEGSPARGSKHRRGARTIRDLAAFIVLPTLLIGAAALAAMNWHVPTPVQLDLQVERMAFELAGTQSIQLPPEPLSFTLLSVENFDALTFTPIATSALRRSLGDPAGGRQVVVKGEVEPLMVLEPTSAGDAPLGRLQSLTTRPGSSVTIEAKQGRAARVTLRIDGPELDATVLPAREVAITVSNARLEGSALQRDSSDPLTMQAALSADQPMLHLQGARRSFAITAELSAGGPLTLLSSARAKAVHFKKQGTDGRLESSIVAGGTLSYPDHAGATSQRLDRGDFLELGEREEWVIERLELQPAGTGMTVRLRGVGRDLQLISGGQTRELRLTAFESLWSSAHVAVLFSVAVWAASVFAGAYRLYRELGTTA
jgi:hypothetical protein